MQQLLREINDIVDLRKRLFSEAGVATLYEYNALGRPVEPAILLAIDNFAEYVETFGNPNNPDDENNLLSALVALARQAKAYGVHIVVTANRFNVLSSKLFSLFTEQADPAPSPTPRTTPASSEGTSRSNEIPGRGMVRVARARRWISRSSLIPGRGGPAERQGGRRGGHRPHAGRADERLHRRQRPRL